ncbi:glycerol-3-phosphate dehydrogenase [NAD(+)], cytoplasmic-like, partial [Musca vetustissima]|uniref:glycerol-3-phosphate dehydrogenase [NAD(+)], cytoplasmic-like n=1 Tax=Musca vetustissima TaxID=27455 RepID=UPI002AB669C4
NAAVGKIVVENAATLQDVEDHVNMFVYDEFFDGVRLRELINNHHIIAKYLPLLKLPSHLVACTDLVETAKYADIIVFVIPKQFIEEFCKTLLGKIKSNTVVIKGSVVNATVDADANRANGVGDNGGIQLISKTIGKFLK